MKKAKDPESQGGGVLRAKLEGGGVECQGARVGYIKQKIAEVPEQGGGVRVSLEVFICFPKIHF